MFVYVVLFVQPIQLTRLIIRENCSLIVDNLWIFQMALWCASIGAYLERAAALIFGRRARVCVSAWVCVADFNVIDVNSKNNIGIKFPIEWLRYHLCVWAFGAYLAEREWQFWILSRIQGRDQINNFQQKPIY